MAIAIPVKLTQNHKQQAKQNKNCKASISTVIKLGSPPPAPYAQELLQG